MKIITLAFLVLCHACGVTTTTGPEGGEGGLSGAWLSFQQETYGEALTDFQELSSQGALFPEATMGQAWCQLMLSQPGQAALSFQRALQADPEQTAARVGEAFSLRDANPPDYNRLLVRAREALQADPSFIFEHRNSIDWQDLHVLMGQGFFYQQQFDSSLAHLKAIDSTLLLTVEDTLSWQGHASFQTALFAELLRLGELTAN